MAKENSSEFPKKLGKLIPQEFEDACLTLSTEDLKTRIVECEKHIVDISAAMIADEEYQQAKEKAKQFGAVYKENRKIEAAKIQYCLFVLEGRGAAIE